MLLGLEIQPTLWIFGKWLHLFLPKLHSLARVCAFSNFSTRFCCVPLLTMPGSTFRVYAHRLVCDLASLHLLQLDFCCMLLRFKLINICIHLWAEHVFPQKSIAQDWKPPQILTEKLNPLLPRPFLSPSLPSPTLRPPSILCSNEERESIAPWSTWPDYNWQLPAQQRLAADHQNVLDTMPSKYHFSHCAPCSTHVSAWIRVPA